MTEFIFYKLKHGVFIPHPSSPINIFLENVTTSILLLTKYILRVDEWLRGNFSSEGEKTDITSYHKRK